MDVQVPVKEKKSIVELFMNGCKKGFYIGVEKILPALLMGAFIVQFLKLTGLVDILGNVCGPVMNIFGLPGESIVVILSAFFSKGAGAATAFSLYSEGMLTAVQCTILIMPCMLMGTLVGHYARIVLVAETNPKHRMILLIVPIIDSIIGMFAMKLILSVMGLL
ncbi:nucleoside recognition domain-containing protein [Intestinibacter sp.]|uniref:nucleoside recognition domain-containing protein n=1 Tax=Intestinibacter sp. TaxID=1965304 RepID=UPI003F164700